MTPIKLSGLLVAGSLLAGCTTAELAAFNDALTAASYQNNYGYNSPYSAGTGTWVGYNQCAHTGSFYHCDTNGDGWVDSFGNTNDGSYTSSHLKVNGKGEGFTRGKNGEWVRNPAYDTSERSDHHHPRRKHD